MGNEVAVIVFVRSPDRGTVKSRLATALGDDAALDLYRCFVADTMDMLAGRGCSVIVFFHPAGSLHKVGKWLGKEAMMLPQRGGDIGEKMKNAFAEVFARGIGSAVLVGSDIPGLSGLTVDEAFMSLKDHDAVLGPSHDGGYYLIGFTSETFRPEAFEGISWSTPEVFRQTKSALEAAKCTIHVLPGERDIDTVEDLRAFFRDNRSVLCAGRKTMRYIESRGPGFLDEEGRA